MELILERGDLLQLDPITNRGTLKLLPAGKKGKQKLVIGDDSGTLSCYEFKKGEPQQVFTTKVFDEPVTHVSIGGTTVKQDKIFAGGGQKILGITKKGKEFFKLTSSLTETINNIIVDDSKLWTSCEFIYNMYNNGVDKEFFMCKDIINCMIVDHVSNEQSHDALFGCQDNCIRIVQGSQMMVEIPTVAPVTELANNVGFVGTLVMLQQQNAANSQMQFPRKSDTFGLMYVVYGMENGAVGMVRLQYNNPKTQSSIVPVVTHEECWVLDDWCRKRTSSVTALQVFDLNKNGTNELIVGRDDGRVEVYTQGNAFIPGSKQVNPPQMIFSKDINESVRSLECGLVNSMDFNEIIIAGYSGKIISFTTEQMQERAQDDKHGRSLQTVSDENRIKHLRTEIDQLRGKVDKEREKLKKMSTVATDIVTNTVLDFPINSKFILDVEQGMYIMTIELQVPIDLILLRSSVLLDLVEAEVGTSITSVSNQTGATISADAVMSKGKTTSGDTAAASINNIPAKFCASFRCQGNERRIRVNLRSMEGDYGDLDVTVVTGGNSHASKQKSAKILKFPLKPLSLHSRVNSNTVSADELDRPMMKLRFSGNSLQMHMIVAWIQTIFTDVPQKLLGEDSDMRVNEVKLFYRNVFTHAIAIVEFRAKELRFECESASTIAIIKENITRLATYHRVNIDESVDVNDDTIESFLTLVSTLLLVSHLLYD